MYLSVFGERKSIFGITYRFGNKTNFKISSVIFLQRFSSFSQGLRVIIEMLPSPTAKWLPVELCHTLFSGRSSET